MFVSIKNFSGTYLTPNLQLLKPVYYPDFHSEELNQLQVIPQHFHYSFFSPPQHIDMNVLIHVQL